MYWVFDWILEYVCPTSYSWRKVREWLILHRAMWAQTRAQAQRCYYNSETGTAAEMLAFVRLSQCCKKVEELDRVLAQLPPGHDDFRRLVLTRKREIEGR